jgi:uncharacterized protein YkwD
MPAVKLDGRLDAFALKQAHAMADSGTISHTVGGEFSKRVAPLRKYRAAETSAPDF